MLSQPIGIRMSLLLVQSRERKVLNIGNWLANQGSLVLTENSTGMQRCTGDMQERRGHGVNPGIQSHLKLGTIFLDA